MIQNKSLCALLKLKTNWDKIKPTLDSLRQASHVLTFIYLRRCTTENKCSFSAASPFIEVHTFTAGTFPVQDYSWILSSSYMVSILFTVPCSKGKTKSRDASGVWVKDRPLEVVSGVSLTLYLHVFMWLILCNAFWRGVKSSPQGVNGPR